MDKNNVIKTIKKDIDKAKYNLEVAKEVYVEEMTDLRDTLVKKYEERVESLRQLQEKLSKH